MVYISVLPLYRIQLTKGDDELFFDEDEFQKSVAKYTSKGVKFETSRFKGLGEVDSKTLHKYGFDPEHRRLLKITMEDAEYAADMIDKLMGEEVSYRKKMLQEATVDLDKLDL